MTVRTSHHLLVASFADHIDAIPFYIGYAPEDVLVMTVVNAEGPLSHRVSPVGPILQGGSLSTFVDMDYSGTRLILLVALGGDARVGENVLQGAIRSLRHQFENWSARGVAAPQVSAGWASVEHYAEMQRNGSLGGLQERTLGDLGVQALLSDVVSPPASREDFLRLLKHTGEVFSHEGPVDEAATVRTTAVLEVSFSGGADAVNPSAAHLALLGEAAAQPRLMVRLMGGISRESAGYWRAVWHRVAIHSTPRSRAATYAIAAFAAWVDGHGVFAQGYLEHALMADSSFTLAEDMADAINDATPPSQWLSRLRV